MADHQTARAVVVQALQIQTGAVILGLVDIGIQAEVVGQRPVDGCAVLQLFREFAAPMRRESPADATDS